MVFGTAWRILGHAADAEDVAQEVFLQAHQVLPTRTVRNWGGFLRRLAACRAVDRLRQRRPGVSLDTVALPSPREGPDEAAIAAELAERLRQAVSELPPREATVFCLRYFEDLSYQQIAETLQIESGAVAQALLKARAKLEGLLLGATPRVGEGGDG